jgi:large subunit ribosomal protein L14e
LGGLTSLLSSFLLIDLQSQNILGAWNATSWAKKMASKKTRASLSDFDRFKVMIAKKQKSKIITEKVAELSA